MKNTSISMLAALILCYSTTATASCENIVQVENESTATTASVIIRKPVTGMKVLSFRNAQYLGRVLRNGRWVNKYRGTLVIQTPDGFKHVITNFEAIGRSARVCHN